MFSFRAFFTQSIILVGKLTGDLYSTGENELEWEVIISKYAILKVILLTLPLSDNNTYAPQDNEV